MVGKQSVNEAYCAELLNLLSPIQKKFVLSKSRLKVARCTRRAGKCIKEGTEVLTPTGPVPIEKIQVGQEVYGYNLDGSVSLTPVLEVVYQGFKKVVDLECSNKIVATATPDHRWMTWRSAQNEKVRTTRDLSTSYKIRREFVDIPCGVVEEPHAYAIGALLGDGCTKDARVNQKHISSEDWVIPKRVADVLGAKYVIKRKYNYTWAISNSRARSRTQSGVHCNYYDAWMRGKGSSDKNFDYATVDTWTRSSCLGLIAGLLDTDGSVYVSPDGTLSIRWSSNNEALIDNLNRLLFKLYQFHPGKHKESRADHWVSSIKSNLHGKRILRELSSYLAVARKKYLPAYDALSSRNKCEKTIGVKRARSYEAHCWDLSIGNETHLYLLANEGLITHNTFVDAAYLIYTCLRNPDTPCLYAGLTRDSAKEAIWKLLVDFLHKVGIPHQAKESTLQILFNNGSKITLFGCDMANARNRLRSRKFKLIIFDETGFFAALDDLVGACLPMLMDFGGTLCMTSSPGELLQGLFYKADQGKDKSNWDTFFWTSHENPHFQKPPVNDETADSYPAWAVKCFETRAQYELWFVLKTKYAYDEENPEYRREFLGEWVKSKKSLVYPVTEANVFDKLKIMHPEYAVSVNLSHPFISTLIVGRYSEYSRYLSIEEHIDLPDRTFDQFAEVIRQKMAEYKTNTLIGYIGDYSKDIATQFKRRYKLPLLPMDRKDLSYHQRIYAADVIKGNVQIKRGLQVFEEHGTIVKDKEGNEIDGQVNHASNTCLALHRRIYQTHLAHYVAPLSEEERHIKQLEGQVNQEQEPWYNR